MNILLKIQKEDSSLLVMHHEKIQCPTLKIELFSRNLYIFLAPPVSTGNIQTKVRKSCPKMLEMRRSKS